MPRLDEPTEYAIIKQVYFGDKPLSDDAEREAKRNKKETNQAR